MQIKKLFKQFFCYLPKQTFFCLCGVFIVAFSITAQTIPVADGFDYPIGNRGYNSNTPISILEHYSGGYTGERNTLFPSNANNSNTRYCNSLCGVGNKCENLLWYSSQDLGSYLGCVTNSAGVTTCYNGMHPGEDWNNKDGDVGAKIYAIGHGKVIYKKSTSGGGFIGIEHSYEGTKYYSFYGHLSNSTMKVDCGDIVYRGQLIGDIGSEFSPPHLHFELRNDSGGNVEFNQCIEGNAASNSTLYPNDNDNGYYTSLTNFTNDGFLDDPSDFIDDNRPSGINGGMDIYAGNVNNTNDIYLTFSFPHSNFDLNAFRIDGDLLPNTTFNNLINLGNDFYRVQVNLPNNLLGLYSNGIMYNVSFELLDNNTNYVYLIEGKNQLYFSSSSATSFSDLAYCTNKAEFEYIEKVIEYGLFKGINGNFLPDNLLTREQVAKLVCQLAINSGYWTELDAGIKQNGYFDDVDICRWSFPYVQTLRNKGAINAVNNFNPENSITYGQLCKILVIALGIQPNSSELNIDGYDLTYECPSDPPLTFYMNIIHNRVVLGQFFGLPFAEPLHNFGKFNNITFQNNTYNVNGDNLITRAESSILFANLYDYYYDLNSASFPSAKIQTNDLSDWNIVGGKLNASGNSNSQVPTVPSQTTTINLDSGETFTSNTGALSDSYGNPVTYFWAIEGGTLNSLATKHNKVEWIAPTVSQTTTYKLYVWVQNSKGNYAHGVYTIVVSPETTDQPTLQADNIQFESITSNSADICWDRGNGNYCIVTATPIGFSIIPPEDGEDYNDNSHFSAAPFIEFGEQTRVIYVGTGNEVSFTGLNESTYYKIRVYEFNDGNAGTNYLTSGPAAATLSTPASDTEPWLNPADFYPADDATLSNNSVTLSFPATWGENPKYYTVYFADWNPTAQPPIVENTTNTTFTVSNLDFNETYYWKVYVEDIDGDSDWSPQMSFTILPESNPPTGTVTINNGDATTNSISVSLSLSASDTQGTVTHMRFSNDGNNWTYWTPFTSTYGSWSLGSYGGNTYFGTKTVYAQFRDNSDNISVTATDNIDLEEGVPGYFIVRGKEFASLRAAIEYANSGDNIYATAGYFDLTDEATSSPYSSFSTSQTIGAGLKSGVNIIGEGPEKTTLYWNNGFYGLVLQGNNIVEGVTLIRPPQQNYTRYVLGIGAASNCTIRNCVFKNSYRAIRTFEYGGTAPNNITIENCQIYGNDDFALYIDDVQTLNIYNSVIYGNTNWPLRLDDCSDIEVKNNIITGNQKEGVTITDYTNLSFTHNNVWNNINIFNNQEENYNDCSSCLQDQTGTNGNISQNPQYESTTNYDFQLKSNSPCINTGTDVGNPYIGSNPDMGVFEYNATGTLSIMGTIAANYTITKPDGSSQVATNGQNLTGLELGMYGVFPQEKEGYYTPEIQFFYIRAGETKVYNLPYILDTAPPVGEILVNGGDYFTQSRYVTIFNDIVDEVNGIGGNSEMQFSNDGVSWSSAEPISNKKRLWDLGTFGGNLNEGEKTVYAKFSDENGYWSDAITDVILYKPNGSIIVVPIDTSDVDDALEAAAVGDVVYILPGTYEVNQDGSWGDIYINTGRKLQGAGIGNTIFNFHSDLRPQDNSSIDGITFENSNGYIYPTGNEPIIFSNVKFNGIESFQIFECSNRTTVRNCIFKNLQSSFGFINARTVHCNPILSITNSVFDAEIADLGSQEGKKGLYIDIDSFQNDSMTIVRNSIFTNFDTGTLNGANSGASGGVVVEHEDDHPTDIVIDHNNYYNSIHSVYLLYGPAITQQKFDNYDNPLFVDTANYHLSTNSPIKNIGNSNLLYRNHDNTNNTLGIEGGPFYNTPPMANLGVSPSVGSLNTIFTFNASESSDEQTPVEFLQFRWDFNDDGIFDTDFLTSSSIDHQFSEFSEDSVVLWVFDEHFAMHYVKIPNPLVSSNILVSNLNTSTLCPNESFTVSYTVSTLFNNNNIFTAELSNSAGDFINAIPLGSVNSTTNGSINCTLPTGIASSDNYKIRIVASNPPETSTSTNTFSVQEATIVSIGGGLGMSYLTTDTPISLDNLGSPSGGVFTINGNTTNTFNPSILGEGNHAVTYSFTQGDCTFSTSRTVEVCLPIGFTLSVLDNEACAGQTVNLSYVIDGKFETNNDFSVELSLPDGSFISPILIATIPSTSTSGTLPCVLPNYVSEGNSYRLRIIASNPYTVSSPTNSFVINEAVFPTISINSSPSEICEGESVTFTADYTNGGNNPSFQWKVNNVSVGTNSPTFNTNSLQDGDVVSIEFSSNADCASSSAINDVLTSNIDQCSNCTDGVSVTYTNTSNLPNSVVVSDFIILSSNVEVTANQYVDLQAGKYILFEPGFEGNGTIAVNIQDCEVSQQTESIPQNLYSNKGLVEVEEGQQLYMKAFPNPFTDKITIEYLSLQEGITNLYLLSTHGTKVKYIFSNELREAGKHKVEFEPCNIPDGIYIIVLEVNGLRKTFKISKMNTIR